MRLIVLEQQRFEKFSFFSDHPVPSRGAQVDKLKTSFWLHGPGWLKESKDRWPREAQGQSEPAECKAEEKKQALRASSFQAVPSRHSSHPAGRCAAAYPETVLVGGGPLI